MSSLQFPLIQRANGRFGFSFSLWSKYIKITLYLLNLHCSCSHRTNKRLIVLLTVSSSSFCESALKHLETCKKLKMIDWLRRFEPHCFYQKTSPPACLLIQTGVCFETWRAFSGLAAFNKTTVWWWHRWNLNLRPREAFTHSIKPFDWWLV